MSDMREFTEAADGVHGEETEIRRTINFGWDMENFLRSDVGRYLTARAEIEITQTRAEFESIDMDAPGAAGEVRKLQLEIAVRKVWKDWIQGAIDQGQAAQEQAIEQNQI